ncbi:MAG: hypothetical protein SGBAC_012184, partial [Bacillariaceae sp.]
MNSSSHGGQEMEMLSTPNALRRGVFAALRPKVHKKKKKKNKGNTKGKKSPQQKIMGPAKGTITLDIDNTLLFPSLTSVDSPLRPTKGVVISGMDNIVPFPSLTILDSPPRHTKGVITKGVGKTPIGFPSLTS